MYTALGQGQTTSRGQNFDVNRNIFLLRSFLTNFKKISLKSDFIHIFNDFIHVYSPGAVADNPLSPQFWCQQNGLITLPICCKFQKHLFEVWLYTFFSCFIHVYSPRAGADNPLGTKFWCQQKGLITLHICCKFQKNLFEVWFHTHF